MSWTEVGSPVRKVSLLPPKFQALVAAARRRGHRWFAARYLRVDKHPGGKRQIGYALWIPRPAILGFSQTGLFIGETHEKTVYRFVRSHPLARTLKEAHHVDVLSGWSRKGFRSHGYPTFAHWLEYREIRERAGKTAHGYEFWRKAMESRWWDKMSHRAWPKYPGAVQKMPYSNPRRRARRNAGWPKHPYLRYGSPVRATQAIKWRDVRVPKGAVGKVLRMLDGGEGVHVDFGKYGTLQCLAYEVRPVGGAAAKNPRTGIRRRPETPLLRAKRLARERKSPMVLYHDWETGQQAVMSLRAYETGAGGHDIKESEVVSIVWPSGETG